MDCSVIYNYRIIFMGVLLLNILYFSFLGQYFNDEHGVHLKHLFFSDKKYLIDTPGCRIENVNPYSGEIADFVYKMKNISCRNKGLLTYVTRTRDEVVLNINASLLRDYSAFKIHCCYSTIKRNPTGETPDDNLSFSDCTYFTDSVIISENFVKVECNNFFHKVYENVHSTLQRPDQTATHKDAPNVLLIGIDGVSRSNFIRSMPKTFQFCEKHNWINLQGFNKIADNTYPNLAAVLAGVNFSQATESCDPYDRAALNECKDFIWSMFKKYNYSTAYAEDTPKISTFNGDKAGFTNPPTDYYFRPYFLAAEDLTPKYLCLKAHCTGPEKTGIRMQGLIKDFMDAVRGRSPAFGLFWMNSFSHEDVNCPSTMDEDFLKFLEGLDAGPYLDNTFVIFFSDHGFRFGKIRQTHTGWMEERLPFAYVWVPRDFRVKHEREYKNLLRNSENLATPYHLYMTLQHILGLSNKDFVAARCRGCPECRSLFTPMHENRSCDVSGIPPPYCTCSRYEKLDRRARIAQQIADFLVPEINRKIRSYGSVSAGCSTYFLNRITHARSLVLRPGLEENVLLGVVTNPEAVFEATVKVVYRRNGTEKAFTLMETNRLDRYAPKTFCVRNAPIQMYCHCRSVLRRLTNVFCNNKFCFVCTLFDFTVNHQGPPTEGIDI